jgi:hypothetical protein
VRQFLAVFVDRRRDRPHDAQEPQNKKSLRVLFSYFSLHVSREENERGGDLVIMLPPSKLPSDFLPSYISTPHNIVLDTVEID